MPSVAIISKIKFPFFSLKHIESYQVAVSYPVIFPSTLVGAFGYALSLLGECKGDECSKAYSNYILKAREFVNESRRTIISSKFPVILKRFRTLEHKGNNYNLPEKIDKISKSTDAMVREYVFTPERDFVFIVKNDKEIDVVKKALRLIDRLGDSESLVSVIDVREEELTECTYNNVNVMVKGEFNFTENTLLLGLDENGNKSLFAIPYKIVDYSLVYSPIQVKKGNVLCGKSVRIPKGGDW